MPGQEVRDSNRFNLETGAGNAWLNWGSTQRLGMMFKLEAEQEIYDKTSAQHGGWNN